MRISLFLPPQGSSCTGTLTTIISLRNSHRKSQVQNKFASNRTLLEAKDAQTSLYSSGVRTTTTVVDESILRRRLTFVKTFVWEALCKSCENTVTTMSYRVPIFTRLPGTCTTSTATRVERSKFPTKNSNDHVLGVKYSKLQSLESVKIESPSYYS